MLIFLYECESREIGKKIRKRAIYECDNCKSKIERTFEKLGNISQNGCSSCRLRKLKPLKNIINNIKVIKDLGMNKEKKPKREALFLCFCGNEFKSTVNNIVTFQKKSCGCLKYEASNFTHLLSKHPLYVKWAGMITRTTNKKENRWHRYGGRGITICDEWRNDFMSFYNWSLENGYKDGLTIDRINNDGNYEPSNCQWITLKENCSKDGRAEFIRNTKSIEVCNRYKKGDITIRKLAKELGTYTEVLSKILKDNNIEITQRRMKK